MINVGSRINARKVSLIYFYEKLFSKEISQKDVLFDDIIKIDKLINLHEDSAKEKKDLQEEIFSYYSNNDWKEDIDYIMTNLFRKEIQEWSWVDMEFVNSVVPVFEEYIELVSEKVNSNTNSFVFSEMDIIDRAIFLLWYIEFHIIKTPKSIVMNEMIELAKRYWDASSQKLINAIWHNILEEDSNTKQ